MRVSYIKLAVLAAVSGLALSGCAYGYDGNGGFGGLNVGYGYNSGYGYGGYGYDPYGYGYGYGSPYGYGDYGYSPYGWYDGYYYPGSGVYVYDSYRRRTAWNDTQRRYWQDRTNHWRDRRGNANVTTTVVTPRENWSGFNRDRTRSDTNRSSDNGRGRWSGRSSSQSSSSNNETTTSSDNRWHGRGRHND